ncbi:MAG: phenylalanine--tRNA ligase subunit beta [Nitrospiraceae bacterium]|nr:phenylalanine--tRNA ligase subunit beta [Nitrospiraceae bacterium]
MRISFNWLAEFIKLDLGVQEIARLLTMAGLEVEAVEYLEDDTVLEINVTPNRPDCLSILGIARELSALTGKNGPAAFCLPRSDVDASFKPAMSVEVRAPSLCARYSGREIRGVRIGPSPHWLVRRLEIYGIRPINNVVDVTNYVLVELGHPMHAFDLDTIRDGKVIVDAADNIYRKIKTLDGVERKLPEDAVVIADGEGPIALGGIMGGAYTEVDDSTANIFLEAAWFDARTIRKTSKALGLASESSYRFERGADIEIIPFALDRAAWLITELAGGKASGITEAYPEKFTPPVIHARPEKISKLLGANIGRQAMGAIFSRLGLNPEEAGEEFVLTSPSYRPDLRTETDIAEEVARIWGYENIPVSMPHSPLSAGGVKPAQALHARVKESLRRSGFFEAINFTFMNGADLDLLGLPENDARRRTVSLMNPLNKEESLLRTMLVPGLIHNLKHNMARGVRDVKLFETGRIFIARKPGELPAEALRAAGISFERRAYSLWKQSADEYYRAKGAVEAILDDLGISQKDRAYASPDEPFLHPGKSASLLIAGKKAGFIGVLSPAVKEKFDIKSKEEITLFGLDLDVIFPAVPDKKTYSPIPKFPYIERDVALVVDETAPAESIAELIRQYHSPFIEDVAVFDYYKGEHVPKGKKSIAFNIRYRSAERTLTELETDEAHKELLKYLAQKTGATLRE